MRADFAAFFRQEYPRVVLLMIKDGASEAEAEDVTQEAMAQLFRRWERVKSPRAWVRKAAMSVRIQRATRARRELPVAATLLERADPAAEADLPGEQWQVVRIIRCLPPAQRTVIALHYDGLTLEEIADVLAKPVATVRSLLRHGRTRLKEVIQSHGISTPVGRQ